MPKIHSQKKRKMNLSELKVIWDATYHRFLLFFHILEMFRTFLFCYCCLKVIQTNKVTNYVTKFTSKMLHLLVDKMVSTAKGEWEQLNFSLKLIVLNTTRKNRNVYLKCIIFSGLGSPSVCLIYLNSMLPKILDRKNNLHISVWKFTIALHQHRKINLFSTSFCSLYFGGHYGWSKHCFETSEELINSIFGKKKKKDKIFSLCSKTFKYIISLQEETK